MSTSAHEPGRTAYEARHLGEREAVAPEIAHFDEAYRKALATSDADDWMTAALYGRQLSIAVSGTVTTLRTENETLRAERDAAIARAEALAKVSLIQARELKRMDPNGATPPALDAAMADLRHALTTPEHPHGD